MENDGLGTISWPSLWGCFTWPGRPLERPGEGCTASGNRTEPGGTSKTLRSGPSRTPGTKKALTLLETQSRGPGETWERCSNCRVSALTAFAVRRSTTPCANPQPHTLMLQLQGQRAHHVRCKEEHYPICKSAALVKVWVNLGASAALNPNR